MADMEFEYKPQLTLNADETPEAPKTEDIINAGAREIESVPEVSMEKLSESERKAVMDFAEKIDITDTNQIMQYGAGSQKNIADFSASALGNVRTKDMGAVGAMLTNLVSELKGLNIEADEKKGLRGLFRKGQSKISELKSQYDKAEVNVDKIVRALEGHQIVLMKDIAMLDKMYELNQAYHKELSMYILAGKYKLKTLMEKDLPELRAKAEKSGTPEDAQAANDFENMVNRFDKKLHDLEITRVISVQMAPQIRLIQNNDTTMVEKIQTSLSNTIPLWKSQMVLALGIAHSQQAMEAQRGVTNYTNELLRKNADLLKMGSIDIARESERAIVDIETLRHTNESLISTLDEVRRIQTEGSQKRREAEAELGRIELELKEKLLEIKR